jgi:hypothetical protein
MAAFFGSRQEMANERNGNNMDAQTAITVFSAAIEDSLDLFASRTASELSGKREDLAKTVRAR